MSFGLSRRTTRQATKASTLSGWSNLPGKAMLFDQLARLKAAKAAEDAAEKKACRCCHCTCKDDCWGAEDNVGASASKAVSMSALHR